MIFDFKNPEEDKKCLRKKAMEIRGGISKEQREKWDAAMYSGIFSSSFFLEAETIFTYVSMKEEPDTGGIIETSWRMGKKVFVPRCIPGKERRMEAVEIASWEELSPGTMGIWEPKKVVEGRKERGFSLMLIPCVMADKRGGRLGHGAGYYDRFLASAEGVKLCLCYEALLYSKVPMEEKDIFMVYVLSEEGMTSRKANTAYPSGEDSQNA